MAFLRYLTHPQIRLDAKVPVPLWGLSEVGRARVEAFKISALLADTRSIISSLETKALETAAILADHWKLPMRVHAEAHENDRTATGYLPPLEFEKAADLFFAHPNESMRGWEKARDAQHRIVAVTQQTLAENVGGDILMVGHGGVGTLLYCHLANEPIHRIRDQPAGGGNLFCFDMNTQKIKHGWVAMEHFST